MERATDPTQGEPMEECQSEQFLDNPEKEFSDLADMYWVLFFEHFVSVLNFHISYIFWSSFFVLLEIDFLTKEQKYIFIKLAFRH